jgi:hypothetical protein
MKQMKFFGAIIIIATMTACGQAKQKNMQDANPSDWKTFEHRDYTVQYPDSFELNTSGQMGMSFLLLSKQTSPNDMFRENVNLIIQDLRGQNISMDDYVEISENQIKTIITEGNIIESKRIEKDNSEFHEIVFTGKQGVLEVKFVQYYIIKNEKAYVLTLTAETEQFDSYKTVGKGIMDSFKIK